MPHSVLCVDDDRNLCQIIAKALEGEGYRVEFRNLKVKKLPVLSKDSSEP